MDWARAISNITVSALAGGALGLLVGFLLVATTDGVDNPFWSMAVGIGAGAVVAGAVASAREASPGE